MHIFPPPRRRPTMPASDLNAIRARLATYDALCQQAEALWDARHYGDREGLIEDKISPIKSDLVEDLRALLDALDAARAECATKDARIAELEAALTQTLHWIESRQDWAIEFDEGQYYGNRDQMEIIRAALTAIAVI